jgi:hypothetical protein
MKLLLSLPPLIKSFPFLKFINFQRVIAFAIREALPQERRSLVEKQLY